MTGDRHQLGPVPATYLSCSSGAGEFCLTLAFPGGDIEFRIDATADCLDEIADLAHDAAEDQRRLDAADLSDAIRSVLSLETPNPQQGEPF